MTKELRIAALIADGFQEEECLVPRYALQLLGARVDMISSIKKPIEIYSYFEKVGSYEPAFGIGEINKDNYDGILIPGGAKSPLILSEDERIKAFVKSIADKGKMIACICRGALLAANSGVVRGRHITGFVGDDQLSAEKQRELAVEPAVIGQGGIWEKNKQVVVDGNFISSRHPKDMRYFVEAIVEYLWHGTKKSPFDDEFMND
jgi:protease I